MKKLSLIGIAVAALAVGILTAQEPTAQPQRGRMGAQMGAQAGPGRPGMQMMGMNQRIMRNLDLTEAQKQQIQTIRQQANQSAQTLRTQVQENRQALNEAVKANDTAKIQTLASSAGNLHGQILAIQETANAQVYALLTPEQKTKYDQLRNAARMLMAPGPARGPARKL